MLFSSSPSAKHEALAGCACTRSMMSCIRLAVGSSRERSSWRYLSRLTIGLRATPVSIAALATAAGTALIRRGSNGVGIR